MIYLLYFASGYLCITTFILLRNRLNFTSLRSTGKAGFTDNSPKASICVPARNEEDTIKRCVESALNQNFPNFEVIVLDDYSTDRTGEILSTVQKQHPQGHRLRVLRGKPKPREWLGKPWACQQLGEAADGDIIIFADADTWFSKNTIARVVRTMGRDIVGMLTVWPRQVLGSLWEKILIPLVYYALLSLLPVHYVFRSPRWMPAFLYQRYSPLFAAACGQFIAFKKNVYLQIGGHQRVKNKVVDDVELAKAVKEAGFSLRMYYGSNTVACRMYQNEKEIRAGFRKNFLAGFGYNLFLFSVMALIHLVVYVLPYFILVISVVKGMITLLLWSLIPVIIITVHRLLMARWFGWNKIWSFLHPIGVLWFQILAFITVKDFLSGRQVQWKGRSIN